MGHYQYECPTWEDSTGANYTEFDEEEAVLLMTMKDQETDETLRGLWFLDSGCSNHMCCIKGWFSEIDETFRSTVKLGNGTRMVVQRKGSVKLKIEGIVQIIADVYYVPELMNILLSIGQIQERGLKVVFEDNECRVLHKQKGLIISSKMTRNITFLITGNIVSLTSNLTCFQVEQSDLFHLWHYRFGHLSQKGLTTLVQRDMVKGLPKLLEATSICEDCQKGKQHREVFPKESSWRASKVLELILSDICGPITLESNSNKRYFITFIDLGWIYFMSEKSDALQIFTNFKVIVENESGEVIKCLRTDRGGEFNSVALQ